MKRLFLLLILLLSLTTIFSAGRGISISEKIGIVILPAKVSGGWNISDADHLISILEEKALELQRFKVFSRNDIETIIKERNLGDLGITENALQASKLAGARYAILLTLTSLSAQYSESSYGYLGSARLSLKLYDLKNGELLAAKSFEKSTFFGEETYEQAINAVITILADDIWLTLREFFKLEAYVIKVENGKVYLGGIDPKIIKKGFIFKVETEDGNVGFIEILGYNKRTNAVMGKFMYGAMPQEYDPATEYPVSPYIASIGIGLYSGKVSLNMVGWSTSQKIYLNTGIIMANFTNYIPMQITAGIKQSLLKLGRIETSVVGGVHLLSLYDMSETSTEPFLPTFGLAGGVHISYDFEPKSKLFAEVLYTMTFPDSFTQYILTYIFGIDQTSFMQITAGYAFSF
ncbi:hypothetical protein JYK00_01495 [Thermosipho ferrireducens]|uniref:Curli production assembly/transport component CsgG n=1 Tax=Thermosipho ferrireducens TaxID=2571116 RepID=A0ABX7S8M0_9BACT|nr:CsgG/HfaB family protein [Thermosipho ferrireducens]QTA38243.1 hypothetical protein JYK00_01495 [Thermosipho ferrireducens]